MTDFTASRRHFLKLTGLTLVGLPLGLSSCATALTGRGQPDFLVYVGTYAKEGADSIFLYRLNPATGALTRLRAEKGGPNPAFLALDIKRQRLYAAN